MRRHLWHLPLVLLALGAAPATAPSTNPTTAPTPQQVLAERKAAEQKEYTQRISDLPLLPQRQIKDLFTLSLENNELIIRPKLGKTERSRVEAKVLSGPAIIAVGGDQPNTPEGATYVQFEYSDFSQPDEVFHRVQLFASAASMQISCDVEGLLGSRSVALIQSYGSDEPESATRLYVQVFAPVTDDLQVKLTLMAPSFTELRHRYPREAREYLDPMLRELQQATALLAPDPRITSQVFASDFKADAALKEKIDAALAKFDAEDFKVRSSAAKSLQELGEPAALVLMRADRTGWSVDRSNGVDAFLAQFEGQPPAEVSRLKSDPAFLLDCLYSDDESTRNSAAGSLEKILSRRVAVEPNADMKARTAVVDRLYPLLLKPTTNPTTKP